MNILFINEFDCITNGLGGIVRVTQLLSTHFTSLNHHCFLGFFDSPGGIPHYFEERIQFSMPFNNNQLEDFLIRNQIQIIIATLWTHNHINAMKNIYATAHALGVKVIYEVHVMPGHEMLQFVSFDHVIFNIRHRQNVRLYGKKWLFARFEHILRPVVKKYLKKKYIIPYHNSDQIVLLSSYHIPIYAQLIGETDTSKITAIENTLTYSEFATQDIIKKKEKEVLMVGRFSDFEKRISLALQIWKLIEQDSRLTDWTFTIIGDGDDQSYYESLIRKLHLQRVSLVGRQDPLIYYKRASILLMTSAAEGWPMVLMEAAQMGMPATVFDSFTALHEIITNDRNGVIVPNNDVRLFYEKLADLMLDNTKREQMALAAVEDSKRFSAEKVLPKWEALLNQCVSK